MSRQNPITLQDVYLARNTIAPYVAKTPLVESSGLTKRLGVPVFFKLEVFQKTGSFKARGATNKIMNLNAEEMERGVVTASTGNHGRAVSMAARDLGIPAVVCMSVDVPKNKVEAVEAFGAELVLSGKSQDEAFIRARKIQAERGMVMVPPFDDPDVIAGQGTIGLEILEDCPAVGTVLVPLSGGGLISGIALAMKSANPQIKVIGVSMERAPVMYESLRAGKPVQLEEEETLADSLRGGIGLENRFTFQMVRDLVDEVVLVSEEEIVSAMWIAFSESHLVLEGAGAVGIAALAAGKIRNIGGSIVIVLSGGNIDIESFFAILRRKDT